MRYSVFHIIERFPEHRERIKNLFRDDRNFQSMCIDYHRCAEALQHWSRSTNENATVRTREYELLFQELESEIRQCLNLFN